MSKAGQRSYIQVAIEKLEKIIKDSKIKFKMAEFETIEQLLLRDSDIKYVIDHYESVKK